MHDCMLQSFERKGVSFTIRPHCSPLSDSTSLFTAKRFYSHCSLFTAKRFDPIKAIHEHYLKAAFLFRGTKRHM